MLNRADMRHPTHLSASVPRTSSRMLLRGPLNYLSSLGDHHKFGGPRFPMARVRPTRGADVLRFCHDNISTHIIHKMCNMLINIRGSGVYSAPAEGGWGCGFARYSYDQFIKSGDVSESKWG